MSIRETEQRKLLPQSILKSMPPFWRFQIIGWISFITVFTLMFSPGDLESWEKFRPVPLNMALGIALTSLMRRLYIRLQRTKNTLMMLALKMLFTSLIAAIVWMTADYWISGTLWGFTKPHVDWRSLRYVTATDTAILFGWSLLYFALKLWVDWSEESKRSEMAIKLAREAQLQVLRYQLNPHFLFNSLNSIRTLVDENPMVAKQVITELAEFFRYSLLSRDVLYVPLRDEFEAMRHYFAIQRIRYENLLQVEISITPEAEIFPVLSFMVQPLIENAVKYGMQTSSMPLRISIAAEVINGILRLDVDNSGSWVDADRKKDHGTGTGLANIRKALANAFPGAHRLEVIPMEGMVRVRMEIDSLKERK